MGRPHPVHSHGRNRRYGVLRVCFHLRERSPSRLFENGLPAVQAGHDRNQRLDDPMEVVLERKTAVVPKSGHPR